MQPPFKRRKSNRCKRLSLCLVIIVALIYASVFIMEYHNHPISLIYDRYQTSVALQRSQTIKGLQSIDESMQQLMQLRTKTDKPICEYLAIKGLPYSGTNWLKYILTLILDSICKSPSAELFALCIENPSQPPHLGEWYKFTNSSVWDKIDPTMRDSSYVKLQRMIRRQPQTRFCTFVVMRDPRDTVMTGIHWRYRKSGFKFPSRAHSEISDDTRLKAVIDIEAEKTGNDALQPLDDYTVHNQIYQYFPRQLDELNGWWKSYRSNERKSPELYFVYFYEDLVKNPQQIIRDMLVYIGVYPEILSDVDVEYIAKQTRFQQSVKDGIWTMQRKGEVCDYQHTENNLDDAVVEFMNDKMVQHLEPDLLYKLHTACPVVMKKT